MKRKLLILPFDHRSSFSKDILGLENKPNKKEKETIKELKEIIFEAFVLFSKNKKIKNSLGILVDEEYGEKILLKAKSLGFKICLPVEKSGQELLKLEYGNNFKEHINKFNPDFVKILIRYNPNNKNSKKQLKTLSLINDFCQKERHKIILELLVPPNEKDLIISENKDKYDLNLRVDRTIEAIDQIKKFIKVDVWKLEGFRKNQWQKIIKITKKDKIIFLGRGENKEKVVKWLKEASSFKEIIGFAIGRTIFLKPLQKYHNKEINKEKAIKLISNNFDYFVKLWNKS